MKRVVCLILSAMLFVLGIVGLIIPVIPQIPFFAGSILLLTVASPKARKKVMGSELYKKYLQKHIEKSEWLLKYFEHHT